VNSLALSQWDRGISKGSRLALLSGESLEVVAECSDVKLFQLSKGAADLGDG
jgi:hypothetical protein